MVTHLELRNAVEAMADNFPLWSTAVGYDSLFSNPAWSLFYTECRLCHEPVFADQNNMQAHRYHHVLMGHIAPERKKGGKNHD